MHSTTIHGSLILLISQAGNCVFAELGETQETKGLVPGKTGDRVRHLVQHADQIGEGRNSESEDRDGHKTGRCFECELGRTGRAERILEAKEPHEIAIEEADFAYHEAGHAVVAFLEGLPLTQISIERDTVSDGRTISEGQGVIGPNDPYDHFVKQIVVANAGFIAVKRRRGIQVNHWPTQELIESWGGISDLKLIHEATSKICKSKNEITAFKLWTYFRCERFIDEAWRAVEALSKELLAKKRLAKNEIEAILNTFDWQIVPG